MLAAIHTVFVDEDLQVLLVVPVHLHSCISTAQVSYEVRVLMQVSVRVPQERYVARPANTSLPFSGAYMYTLTFGKKKTQVAHNDELLC